MRKTLLELAVSWIGTTKEGSVKKFLFLAVCSLFIGGVSQAKDWEAKLDDGRLVRYRLNVAAATTSTSTVLIDLSDSTNFPHSGTREITIQSLKIDVDKAAASTGTVKVGVVSSINASSGTVTWFAGKEFLLNVSNTEKTIDNTYIPSYLPLRVATLATSDDSVETPYILSNDTTDASSTYQTDVELPSPSGGSNPGPGDIVMAITKTGEAAITVLVEIFYSTARR